jgi:hypothetical protein
MHIEFRCIYQSDSDKAFLSSVSKLYIRSYDFDFLGMYNARLVQITNHVVSNKTQTLVSCISTVQMMACEIRAAASSCKEAITRRRVVQIILNWILKTRNGVSPKL